MTGLDIAILDVLRCGPLTVANLTDRVNRKIVGVVTANQVGSRVDSLKKSGFVETRPGTDARIASLTQAGLKQLTKEQAQ